MVRPSFVLGGRGMEVVHDDEMLKQYVNAAVDLTPERPILIDRFLANAIEAEADALADGVDAFVPAVMEHIELAGIHSGDSACAIPPVTLPRAAHQDHRGIHPPHRPRVEGLRRDEHPVRHLRGQGVHPGGESARLAHRAAGVEGVQRADGPHRHAAHARDEARAT